MNDSVFSSTNTRITVFLAGLFLLAPAAALEIEDLEVSKEDGVYFVRMAFHVAAEPRQIIEVLTDFENPQRLNSDVTEREIVGHEGGVTRVRTKLRSCLLFFCRTLEMMQDVTSDLSEVRAIIVPDGSDFRAGVWLWTVTRADDGFSHVAFEASMEPDVFVPPLFGKSLFRRMLEREVQAIASNLEAETTKQP